MKKLMLASVLILGFLAAEAQAFTVGLYDVYDGSLSSQIDFDTSYSTSHYHAANQYLRIENTGDIPREVRINSGNSNGILSLYNAVFTEYQPDGYIFGSETEADWKNMDTQGLGDGKRGLVLLPNEVRYVYFGTKILGVAPTSNYQAKITMEVIDMAPAASVRPAQKVVTPNGDGVNDTVQFGLTGEFEIKIFNVQGKTVRTLNGINTWDGKDDSGTMVESGVYIYKVKTVDGKVTGMLAVAR